jgi:cytochrome c-type biogenesis protein CcmH/NrfG
MDTKQSSPAPKPAVLSISQETSAPQREEKNKTVGLLEGVITVSLGMVFFGLPLFFTGVTLQGIAFEKQLYFYFWILLATVAWIFQGMLAGEIRIRRTVLDIPILLFFTTSLVSTVLSVDIWRSVWGPFNDPSRGMLSLMALIFALYLILSHFNRQRFIWWLGALMVASAGVLLWTCLSLLGVQIVPAPFESFMPISLLGTLTNTTIFLAAMIPLWLTLIVSSRNEKKPWSWVMIAGYGVILLVSLATLFPLYSFVPWPAVLVGVGVLALFVLAQIVRFGDTWAWLLMLGVVFLVLLVSIFGEVSFPGIKKLPVEALPGVSLSWTLAQEGVKNSFFFGSGPGTYGYDFSLYRPVEYNYQTLSQMRFFQGRGLFFEFLPTLGVVGMFFLTILILMFVSFVLYLFTHDRRHNKLYSLGLFSSVVTLTLGAFLVPVGSVIIIMTVLLAALGLAMLLEESQTESTFWQLSTRVSPRFALVSAFILLVMSAGVIFFFVFIGKAFIADIVAGRALAEVQQTKDAEQFSGRIRQVRMFMPKESQYGVIAGQTYLALANSEANQSATDRHPEKIVEYITTATQLLESARDHSPRDVNVQESLAQAYESAVVVMGLTAERIDPLQAAYEQASRLEPSNPVFLLKLGQLHELRASLAKESDKKIEHQKALEAFEQALTKQNTFAPAYLNMALVKESLGESRDTVIELLKKAQENDPRNQESAYQLARVMRLRGNESDMKQAEIIFNELIKINNKNQNARLNLGLLYEATKRKDEAVKQYQSILDAVSGSDEAAQMTRKQVQTLIDNVRAGRSNLTLENKPNTTVSTNSDTPPSTPSSSGSEVGE